MPINNTYANSDNAFEMNWELFFACLGMSYMTFDILRCLCCRKKV